MIQLLSTTFAWAIVLTLAYLAWRLMHTSQSVHPMVVSWFVIGTIMFALAAAFTATSVLVQGPVLSEWLTLVIVCLRAASAAIFLGIVLHVTGRPRWLKRLADHATIWLMKIL
jgi:hypothetical protein